MILLFILFILLVLIIAFIYVSAIHGSSLGKSDSVEFSLLRPSIGIGGVFNSVKAPLLRSYIGGSPNNEETKYVNQTMPMTGKEATSMQVRSRTNSIEFDRRRTVMTYTISGEGNGLDYSQLRKILKEATQYGVIFEERPITEHVHVSFGSYGGFKNEHRKLNFDPDFFKQHAAIKNVLDKHDSIVKKLSLFKTIKQLIPLGNKFIPKTYTIEEFEDATHGSNKFNQLEEAKHSRSDIKISLLQPSIGNNQNNLETNIAEPRRGTESIVEVKGVRGINPPYIIKKDNTCKQTGIKIVTTKEEYHAAKKELKLNNNAVISEYITKPLTIGGIKMHLRIYVLVSVKSGIIKSFIFDEYKIYLAEAPYKEGDWLNPKIHISGVNQNTKIYKWPDDIDGYNAGAFDGYNAAGAFEQINNSLEECKRVLGMAVVSTNTDKYSESYGGYHLYGIDVLPTKTGQVYILEVNHHPGFGWVTANKEITQSFSYKFFSFILHNTVFPMLGITRPLTPYAENTTAITNNSTLIPFSKTLDKYVLIPYIEGKDNSLVASKDEIEVVSKMNFFNKNISFKHFEEDGNCHIYLIGLAKGVEPPIGYIATCNSEFISIVIMEEFQNRGIATAMIAQLIDIYAARYFTSKETPILKIKRNNDFMRRIAVKLNFTLNDDHEYEHSLKMHMTAINKINGFCLTYKSYAFHSDIVSKFLNAHMTEITGHIQFVHLAIYGSDDTRTLKNSTGIKYNKLFVAQGAELKSVLKIKLLYSVQVFKKCYYELIKKTELSDYLDKVINMEDNISNNQLYSVWSKNHYTITDYKKIKLDEADLVEKYDPPYLFNGKKITIRTYFVLYMAANGIRKCFAHNEYLIIIADKEYSIKTKEDWNDYKINEPRLSYSNFFTSLEEVSISKDDAKYINQHIKKCAELFANAIIDADMQIYEESNSGFLPFMLDYKLIKKDGEHYHPIIDRLYNEKYLSTSNKEDKKYHFVSNYYNWLAHNIIFPHFGLSKQMQPIAEKYINKFGIDPCNILLSPHIKFSNIEIFHKGENIGNIELTKSDNNINVVGIKLDEQYQACAIFILMEILAAYYSPNVVSLILPSNMDAVAYKLEFYRDRTDTTKFIRSCRQ